MSAAVGAIPEGNPVDITNPQPSADTPIRYLGDIQKLSLQPNEVLVLSCDQYLDDETWTRVRKELMEETGAARCVILHSGVKLGAVSLNEQNAKVVVERRMKMDQETCDYLVTEIVKRLAS